MKITVSCKSGNIFFAVHKDFLGAEAKLEIAYYKAQGCIVNEVETFEFTKCSCSHCEALEHNFHELLEEVKND